MAEKLLVPVYLPGWLHRTVLAVKRAFIPPAPPPPRAPLVPVTDISGERNVEWAFLSTEMPYGPGEAIEFGCEHGYLSLLAAQQGFHVVANDLEEQIFTWVHPSVEFLQGDFLKLSLPREHFDLVINCSSVEHVGVTGRYGIEIEHENGDVDVMNHFADILKPSGVLIMTVPCGIDTVMTPWCRVYGLQRLPKLMASFIVTKEEYWIKNIENQWVRTVREDALNFQARNDPSNPHGCAYALGCFVLRKRSSNKELVEVS